MASNSDRRSPSSGRSAKRKRVVIGPGETVRVSYDRNQPRVESERSSTARQASRVASKRAGVGAKEPSRAGKRLSASKREERERRQRTIRLRRILAVVAAIAVVAGLVWGLAALYRAPLFTVRTTKVAGVDRLTREHVLKIAEVPDDATLLRLPADEIERRLEADPWIRSATIERDFPGTLEITVKERAPAAVVDLGGKQLWVVSTDDVWLGKRSEEDTALPVIRDVEKVVPKLARPTGSPEISNAIKVLGGIGEELKAIVRVVTAPSVEKTALITEDDIEIFVGEAVEMEKKDRIAREILKREKGKVVYINVRVTDRPTWRGLEEQP